MPLVALRSTIAASLFSVLFGLPLLAQQPAAAESPAQVLVLGTYHFANPGQDVVKVEVADVLSASRQAEIRAVTEELARFRPTKIAVERELDASPRLDELYDAYRAGEHELSRSETQQLGFRLAARFEHPRVFPIDHDGEFPFGAVMEYAERHDPEFVTFADREIARLGVEADRRQRENTIGEILRLMNDPGNLADGHGTYMRFARVGARDTNVGAELVSKWYERNIHIFANLQGIAKPGDRVLVIIGGGHAPILRHLITSDPGMSLVEALDYLP